MPAFGSLLVHQSTTPVGELMLQITTSAAATLNAERQQRGIPDSYGLRVHQERSNSTAGLRLEFTPAPDPGDEVGETEGVRVFVAPDLADALAEQAIDTTEDSGLVLRSQRDLEA
jgi:Fe-S cluster assembly iron-binding protein IscA